MAEKLNGMFGWGPSLEIVEPSDCGCCEPVFIVGCKACKKESGARYRDVNDFTWTVTPDGVANGNTESVYDMCVRYRAIAYPGGPGTYPPMPTCVNAPHLCDDAPCTDYNKAFSISSFTSGGPMDMWFRAPWWQDCDGTFSAPLFKFKEFCTWAATVFATREGEEVVDVCTSLSIGIAWVRLAEEPGSVKVAGWATMRGPDASFDAPSKSAFGYITLDEEDGLVECDGFDESIPLTLTTPFDTAGHLTCPPDDLTRCTLPTSLRLQGLL